MFDAGHGRPVACLAVVESLFAQRVLDHLRAVQGLLRLADSFGRGGLGAACSRALNFGTASYRTTKAIRTTGLDQQPELISRHRRWTKCCHLRQTSPHEEANFVENR